jgi:hypothetical protein
MKPMILLVVATVWLLLVGCATTAAPNPEPPTLDDVAFQAAIGDARGQSAANVYDGLFAVSDDNPKLIWRDLAAKKRLKVVSLMSQASYDKYYTGVPGGVTSGVYAWVTLAPQIQAFCRATGLAGDALKDRLREHLGLVPGRPYDVFVELWVDRTDLFRPCPDPETNDTACDVTFPMANGLPVVPTVKGVDDYLAWFNATYARAYAAGGAPWTRLGYTYDWNPGTPKFGASEYLITKGAAWEVAAAAPVDAYCRP